MKTHCNQMKKVKDQDIVLNAARKKWSVTYKVINLRLSTALSINFADQRYCHNLFRMMKRGEWGGKKKKKKKKNLSKNILPSKAIIHTWRKEKIFTYK